MLGSVPRVKTGKSAPTKTRAGLSVENALIKDTPGQPQTVVACIENTTPVSQVFFVEVIGLNERDGDAAHSSGELEPGETTNVSLPVHIPETIASGCHLLAVRAWVGNKRDPEIEWYTELTLEIADGRRARINVAPAVVEMHRRRKATVRIENLGDDELTFRLLSKDPEGLVKVCFADRDLIVARSDSADGGTATTTATITIDKWKFFGEPIPRVVDITADGPGASHATTLRIEHKPYIPMWLVKTVGTLILLAAFVTVMVILVRAFILDNPTPTWRELEAPLEPRASHTALWVEFPNPDVSDANPLFQAYKWVWNAISRDDDFVEAMIIWGGGNDAFAFDNGAIYLVGADEWRPVEDEGAPVRRLGHTAIWNDERMIVWGGRSTPLEKTDKDSTNQQLPLYPSGGGYDPQTDTWEDLGPGEIAGREQHTAEWIEDYGMVVWGGTDGDQFFADGYVYCNEALDPCDSDKDWVRLPTKNAPTGRAGHVAVWTGAELIIWGGYNDTGVLDDGAAFSPDTRQWRTLSEPGSWFKARAFARAVWTDGSMVILGGIGDGELTLVENAVIAADTDLATPTELARRTGLSTDTVVLILDVLEVAGPGNADRFRRVDNTIAQYDPESDSWESADDPPPATSDPVALWTGARLRLVFGVPEVDTISSVAWVPGETWERLPLPGPNEVIPARTGHTAVWIRGGLVVWGGRRSATECPDDGGCFLNDGGLLPIADR